jgi:Zn-finger nucleic acid-binding protein
MDCPRCSVELSEISREESALHRCGECGGLWIGEVADLNKILLHANLPALSAISGYVNADEISGMCPACNVDLVVVEGGEKRGAMSYDTCESCGGIWIDSDADEPAPELDWKGATGEIVDFFRRFSKKMKK